MDVWNMFFEISIRLDLEKYQKYLIIILAIVCFLKICENTLKLIGLQKYFYNEKMNY